MPWTPKYAAATEETLVANVLAIITRDFKNALDYFYPAAALPDFAEKVLGMAIGNEVPMLWIGPTRNAATPSDDGSHFIEAVKIEIYMAVTGESASVVTEKIMRYARTMVAVLHSANKSDFFANMNSPFGLVVETESIYRPLRGNDSIYFRDSTVELTIQIRER